MTNNAVSKLATDKNRRYVSRMRLPPRPDLTWKEDGTPVDQRVGDVYYSVEDGLAESRAVFLAGCGLPEAWDSLHDYTIAELGFGTGLNFLAAWQMWQANRPKSGWLNFVSFEGYPLDPEDIERALQSWPELADLSARLIDRWPPRAAGIHQITWPEERLTLTLHIGQIEATLPQAVLRADAWFLDGFSPAKNEAMWGDWLWPELAKRSAAEARVATFTVAGAVRRGLTNTGFKVEKKPGHGRKRQRLEAVFTAPGAMASATLKSAPRVAIIGAGIAGACAARVLHERGADITVFDTANGPAEGTSGNPLALVMPRLDAGDTVHARLLVDAYLHAQAFYRGRPGCAVAETVHHPRNAVEQDRFQKLLSDPPLGLEQLEAIRNGGLLHKASQVVRPAHLLPALLEGLEVKWRTQAEIDLNARTVNGKIFDAIILAKGWAMIEACPELSLIGRLGQIEWASAETDVPASGLAAGHYAIASGDLRVWGATYAPHAGGSATTSEAARINNMTALETLSPYWQRDAKQSEAKSRAGIRATTADKVPLIGPMPEVHALRSARAQLERLGWRVAADAHAIPGIYVAGGYGSRGFTWAPWAAAILTAAIFQSPSPARRESLRALAPNRQILRQMKRSAR